MKILVNLKPQMGPEEEDQGPKFEKIHMDIKIIGFFKKHGSYFDENITRTPRLKLDLKRSDLGSKILKKSV